MLILIFVLAMILVFNEKTYITRYKMTTRIHNKKIASSRFAFTTIKRIIDIC